MNAMSKSDIFGSNPTLLALRNISHCTPRIGAARPLLSRQENEWIFSRKSDYFQKKDLTILVSELFFFFKQLVQPYHHIIQ